LEHEVSGEPVKPVDDQTVSFSRFQTDQTRCQAHSGVEAVAPADPFVACDVQEPEVVGLAVTADAFGLDLQPVPLDLFSGADTLVPECPESRVLVSVPFS
jgi:hypothetical protein